MPSITAMIPAYNSEQTIETAIRSVLGQTEPPEEVIVVDDGSTDGTASVVEKLGQPVKLIRQRNQGASVARRTGTAAATSDYMAYLDADDWWPENKIARCREILAREDIDFLLADQQRARPGDGPEAYLPRNNASYPWAQDYFAGRAVTSGLANLYKLTAEAGLTLLLHGFPVYPSAMLVKRSVVADVGGWDARSRRCQDLDIGLRIARRFPLYYLDEVQAILGFHSVNEAAYPYFVMQTAGDIRVLLGQLETEPPGSSYREQVAEALGRKYRALAYLHRKAGQYGPARQCYASALAWPGQGIKALLCWCYASIRSVTSGKGQAGRHRPPSCVGNENPRH